MRIGIHQNILRLDVSVADTHCMNICTRPHELVRVKLNQQRGYHLLHFEVVLHDFVKSIRNEVHDDVEVDLIRFVAVSVEELSHLNAVGVVQSLQNLELSVLVSLVLEYLLNCYHFPSFSN